MTTRPPETNMQHSATGFGPIFSIPFFLESCRRWSGVRIHITPFGEKNFPLDDFVGHEQGRMLCCQQNFVLYCIVLYCIICIVLYAFVPYISYKCLPSPAILSILQTKKEYKPCKSLLAHIMAFFWQGLVCWSYVMGREKIAVPWENLLVIDRTANVLISLRICAVWLTSLLIAVLK